MSELAELAHVRKQTMTQAVEQLERTGYIERRPNPNDRRSRLVFLTERGQVRATSDARGCGPGRGAVGGLDEPEGT